MVAKQPKPMKKVKEEYFCNTIDEFVEEIYKKSKFQNLLEQNKDIQKKMNSISIYYTDI